MPLLYPLTAYMSLRPGATDEKVVWFLSMLTEARRRAGHRWKEVKNDAFDLPSVICFYTSCSECGIYIHMYPEEPHLYYEGGTSALLFGHDIPINWKPNVCDKLKTFA